MADEHGPFMDSGFNDDTIWRFGGCAVRLQVGTVAGGGAFTSGGPAIIADENHIAVGAVSVAVNSSGQIVVTTDGGIAPITSCVVVPDETLAGAGVTAGASHGPTSTVITMSQGGSALDLTTQTDWNAVAGTNANLWISWKAPVVRGVGEPSIAQQCLDLINTNILPRLAALEGN